MNDIKGNLSTYPLEELLAKRRSLRRKLSGKSHLQPVRIAVLGGSTTNEVVDLLDIFLLDSGFRPEFYQSEYGRYYVEAVHDSANLEAFRPDIVYVHTSVINIRESAPLGASESDLEQSVQHEFSRFQDLWNALAEKLGCLVIQNNFEFPTHAVLGNLDASLPGGRTRFVTELNRKFALSANSKLVIQDVCSLSARLGLGNWFDWERWFSYKIINTAEASHALASSLASLVRAAYGKTRKLLVLDLDNTLWGGVIGDDGVDRIVLGRETPLAEAYTAFQEYVLTLRDRGVLLAVCSKNNEEVAKQGFEHPDSVLKLEHISCFKANWDPKHENIAAIARELNLGSDSFVFVDDNPAEREIVQGQVEGIAVPNIGSSVSRYADIIESGRYFEQLSFSDEDIGRAALYQENSQRAAFESRFADYGGYLDSLEMVAEIDTLNPMYLERITQLTNKTNQFNLTTRRYTLAEMDKVMTDAASIALYGRLADRFGDNGLVSVVAGHREGTVFEIDLWLMSCRVLKRDMELAMQDALVAAAQNKGVQTLRGVYLPTKKNGMVREHYEQLGFTLEEQKADGSTVYLFQTQNYRPRNTHIRIKELKK